MDFSETTQIVQNLLSLTPEQLAIHLAQIKGEALQAIVIEINEQNDPMWKEKTRQIARNLTDISQIESMGHVLTIPQLLDLLLNLNEWNNGKRVKLAALLAGISHDSFMELLSESSLPHIQALKQASVSESLHHHLTLFHHEVMQQFNALNNDLAQIEKEISSMDPLNLGTKDKIAFENLIFNLTLRQQRILSSIDKALSIAWNTDREDIIDDLSSAKEYYQRSMVLYTGHPRIPDKPPTGLYALLENRLFAAYGNPYDPKDTLALKESDPAIEALAKFSIWYLSDYFALGLLPSVKDAATLELDPKKFNEVERAEQLRKLFQEAREELAKRGIATVKDLKDASIFSKKSLIEWLAKK